jgi:hypothetical protein
MKRIFLFSLMACRIIHKKKSCLVAAFDKHCMINFRFSVVCSSHFFVKRIYCFYLFSRHAQVIAPDFMQVETFVIKQGVKALIQGTPIVIRPNVEKMTSLNFRNF